MSVNYSLILKKNECIIPINGKNVTTDLKLIDFGTSNYTQESLFNKYFKGIDDPIFDNEIVIRYKLKRVREIPCIFNDKYISIIADPNLNFFKQNKISKDKTIWDVKDITDDSSLFYEYNSKIALGILPLSINDTNNYPLYPKKYIKGITSRIDKNDNKYNIDYLVECTNPPYLLAQLFLKLFEEYRYDFEKFYNKELINMTMSDPYNNLKSSNYLYEEENKTKYASLDYFKRDKNDKSKLWKHLYQFIVDDLTNYSNFRRCYIIIKRFCNEYNVKDIDKYFMNSIKITELDRNLKEQVYEQTSLFKK